MGTSTPTVGPYITVAEAADRLGVKPGDVLRLVNAGQLKSRILVDTASIDAIAQESA